MLKEVMIKLNFSVNVYHLPDASIAAILDRHERLAELLSDGGYIDGRKSFSVEMMEVGLTKKIQDGIRNVLHEHFRTLYGNEMVKTSPTGNTARWSLATDEAMRKIEFIGVNLIWAKMEDLNEKNSSSRGTPP